MELPNELKIKNIFYQYYLYDFSQYTEEDLELNGQFNIDLDHYLSRI